jgi:hypothetical protein
MSNLLTTSIVSLFILGDIRASTMMASVRTSRLAAAGSTRPCRTAVVVKFQDGKRHAPLIDRLGGPAAVNTAVDIFYNKVRVIDLMQS